MVGAFLVSLTAGAGTATAQTSPPTPYPGGGTANLSVTVKSSPESIVWGGTAKYTIEVTNTGPDLATDVTLASVTLPAAPDGISTLQVSAVSGCTPTGKDPVPCTINANMNTPDPQEVTVTVEWVAETDDKGNIILPKTCPAAASTLGDVTFDVTTTTGPASVSTVAPGAGVAVEQFTDVGIAIDGPTGAAVGSNVTYTVTVTNNGPCTANNVIVLPAPGNLLSFQSATGTICQTADEIANGCTPIPAMTVGETVSFTNTFKISSLPDSVLQTTIPVEYDLDMKHLATADVDSSDDSATTGVRTGSEAGGCNVGGATGLLGLLLAGFAVRLARRRRA